MGTEAAAAEKYFLCVPRYRGNIWVFMEQELGLDGLRGPTSQGARPYDLWPPHWSSGLLSKSRGFLLAQEKSS